MLSINLNTWNIFWTFSIYFISLVLLNCVDSRNFTECDRASDLAAKIICNQLYTWNDTARKWDNQSQPIVQPGAAPAAAGQAGSSGNDTDTKPAQPVAPQVAQLSRTPYQGRDSNCKDRHILCSKWKKRGECVRNANWMNANCRKSCDRCSRSRAQDRGDSSSNTNSKTNLNNRGSDNENNRVRTPSKTPQAPGYKPIRPKKSRNFTESCYNENICCQYWATIELCGVYPQPMAGTCPVSCSFCVPKTYYHGTCADYSVHCPYWKRLGECEKNTWMSENCRKSCDTCTNMLDLRKLCQGPMAPLAKEIKWMKSHRRSGLIDGWQGSSRDWNRLSVDAQNYGAQHDQQNSGDAHPTVPSYKPDIQKNTWVREHDWGKQGKMIQ